MKVILLIFILAAFAEGQPRISITYGPDSSEETAEESEEDSGSEEDETNSAAVDEQPDVEESSEEKSGEEVDASGANLEEVDNTNDDLNSHNMTKMNWNDNLKTKPILEAPFRRLFPETNSGFSGKMQVTLSEFATEGIKPFLESFVKIIEDFPASNVDSFSSLVSTQPKLIDGYSPAAKTEILKQLNDATKPIRLIRSEINQNLAKVKEDVEDYKRQIDLQSGLMDGAMSRADGLTYGAMCRLDGAVQRFEGAIMRWSNRRNY